jgi:hypothetical protein
LSSCDFSRGVLECPRKCYDPPGKGPAQEEVQNSDRIELSFIPRCKCRKKIHPNRENEKKNKPKAVVVVNDLRKWGHRYAITVCIGFYTLIRRAHEFEKSGIRQLAGKKIEAEPKTQKTAREEMN